MDMHRNVTSVSSAVLRSMMFYAKEVIDSIIVSTIKHRRLRDVHGLYLAKLYCVGLFAVPTRIVGFDIEH